jgi:MOSC N-terminal beta barrel domain
MIPKPTTKAPLGLVVDLWHYPVKSMLGESCSSLEVNNRGIKDDRLFALRDQQGKFGSGKNTRRFRKIEGLFEFRAIDRQGIPEIQFPDGQRILGNHPDIHRMLSEGLGESVTLSQKNRFHIWMQDRFTSSRQQLYDGSNRNAPWQRSMPDASVPISSWISLGLTE